MKKLLSLLILAPILVMAQSDGVFDEDYEVLEAEVDSEVVEAVIEEGEIKRNTTDPFTPDEIIPIFELPEQVKISETIEVDASESRLMSPSTGRANFSWLIDDQVQKIYGQNLSVYFQNPGIHTVQLNINQGRKKQSLEKTILAYDKQAVLITDTARHDELSLLHKKAAERGIWLQRIELSSGADNVSAEESLIRKLGENLENIKKSDVIVFYTDASRGVQSFLQFWQGLSEENRFELKDKRFVQISDEKLAQIGKRTSPLRESLGVDRVLLTRKDSLTVLIDNLDKEDITPDLYKRGIEYEILDAKFQTTLWPLTRIVNFFVTNGISQTVIYLLLAVPFLTFVISFFRQFVGVSTFGVFAPLMLSLSFLVMGLKFGFMVFAVVMAVSYVIRSVFEKVDMLYIPKVSLLLSFLALSFFFVLGLAIYLELEQNLALTVFPMLVMSTISEKFLASQSSEGMKNAIINTSETVFVALVAYFFVEWNMVNNMITARPEWILLPILGNIWLGRFTGLRLSEYFKFRSLLREDTQEE